MIFRDVRSSYSQPSGESANNIPGAFAGVFATIDVDAGHLCPAWADSFVILKLDMRAPLAHSREDNFIHEQDGKSPLRGRGGQLESIGVDPVLTNQFPKCAAVLACDLSRLSNVPIVL